MTCVFHCHLQNICSRKKGNFSPRPKSSGRAWKKIEAVASRRKKKKVDYPERIEGPGTESRQRVVSFNRLLEPRILLICNSWEEDKRQE